MANPPQGGPEHIQRPAYFVWHDLGVLKLRRCLNPACPNPDGHASHIVLLPETNPRPGEAGGCLCPDCATLPHPDFAHVAFPRQYLHHLVTGNAGPAGSIGRAQITRAVAAPDAPQVAAATHVSLGWLADHTAVPRRAVHSALTENAVPSRPRRRDHQRGQRTVYDKQHALQAVRDHIDVDAYRCDSLPISQAAHHTNTTPAVLRRAAAADELPSHRTVRGHCRFLPHDLDTWSATNNP